MATLRRQLVSKYIITSILGSGTESKVYDAVDVKTGESVAIKHAVIKTKELDYLTKAKDVVGVPKVYETINLGAHSIVYVLTKMPNTCELYYYMQPMSGTITLTEDKARHIFKQLVKIVVDLKDVGVLHGDIKHENIVINTKTHDIMLIDFGGAMDYQEDKHYTETCGTYDYYPPELFKQGWYTADSLNVWTLGLVLYMLLCNIDPIDSSENTPILKPYKRRYKRLLKPVQQTTIDFIESMLSDIDTRLTLQQVYDHDWFKHPFSI